MQMRARRLHLASCLSKLVTQQGHTSKSQCRKGQATRILAGACQFGTLRETLLGFLELLLLGFAGALLAEFESARA